MQTTLYKRITAAMTVPASERLPLTWAFLCFFGILCCYFLLRPIRDNIGIDIGYQNIPELFSYTLACVLLMIPLFGWLTRSYSRKVFMPATFIFCIINLLIFSWIIDNKQFDQQIIARVFYVWLSVFNMFIVALFWSFMNDIFKQQQSKRLFGIIAAGGSLGAICGPLIAAFLIKGIGINNLVIVAAVFLSLALASVLRLFSWARKEDSRDIPINDARPIGGSVFSGVKSVFTDRYLTLIMLIMLIGTCVGTTLYLYQLQVLGDAFSDSATRTQVLAGMDASINALTLILQFIVARFAIKRYGIGRVLMVMPVITILGLSILMLFPGAAVLIVVQILRRASAFGLNNPARESLYSIVSADAKYKAKNFIDVSVVRSADVISSNLTIALSAAAASFFPLLAIGIGLCALWLMIVRSLAARYEQFEADEHD